MRTVQKSKTESKKLLNLAVKILKNRGLVVVPTDTVYVLAVDSTSEQAVKKLIEFKSRPPGKPISVFVGDLAMAKEHVVINKKNMEILKSLLPGPYTIVLLSRHRLRAELESEKGTLGIRIPKNDFINTLVCKYARPITATSANIGSRPHHYSVKSFLASVPKKKYNLIDLIVDGGVLKHNSPSTVLDLTGDSILVLRKGDMIPTNKPKNVKLYTSSSPEITRRIANNLVCGLADMIAKKPLVIIFEGELGAGKTEFVKGIGQYLGIKDIISPTYVIYYEYSAVRKPFDKLLHFDLYKIQDEDEFDQLKVFDVLKPGNMICIEWGEKSRPIYKMLKEKAEIVYVNMKHIDKDTREIEIIL